jgi:hypothetical protein
MYPNKLSHLSEANSYQLTEIVCNIAIQGVVKHSQQLVYLSFLHGIFSSYKIWDSCTNCTRYVCLI